LFGFDSFGKVRLLFKAGEMSSKNNKDRTELRREILRDVGAIAFLGFLVILFFWKIIFLKNQIHIPYDIHDYHYPLAYEIFRGLMRGVFPLWDPYLYSGMPLAGNIQAQLFYAPTLLMALLCKWFLGDLPYHILEYQIIIHYWIAACCAYILARSFKLGRLPAMLAGIVYAFGGYFASQMQHLGLINGAAWIPLIFFFLKRSFDTRRIIYAAGAGAVFSLSILAGFPALLIVIAVVSIFCCVLVAAIRLKTSGMRESLLIFLALAIMFVSAIGISAVQLIPAAELSRYSIAQDQHAMAGVAGVPYEAYLSILLPTVFGSGRDSFWGGIDSTMGHLYMGIAPLILAFIGLLAPSRKVVFFILGITLFGLLWSLGEAVPLSGWIWISLPGMIRAGIYAIPARIFFDLGIALLAAFGLELLLTDADVSLWRPRIRHLLKFIAFLCIILIAVSILLHGYAASSEHGSSLRSRLVTISQGVNMLCVLFLFSGAAIFWRIGKNISGTAIAWVLIVVSVFDLYSYGSHRSFNSMSGSAGTLSSKLVYGEAHPLDLFLNDPDFERGRYMRLDTACGGGRTWLTPMPLWGIASANGDDPLLIKDYAQFRAAISTIDNYRSFILNKPGSPLLDLLSVKYVLTCPDTPFQPSDNLTLVYDKYYRVYKNQNALPRALIVTHPILGASVAASIDQLSAYRSGKDFVQAMPKPAASVPSGLESEKNGNSADIVNYTPNEVEIAVKAESNGGYLLLNDIYFPGWKAFVDGQATEILKANGIFRAVHVDKGSHRVVFRYRPLSIAIGALISLLSLLVIFAAWIRESRIKRRAGPARQTKE
jgi:hypothetical protein